MRKIFAIIVSLGISVVCYPQSFLENSSYIYGVGETDEEALLSLSRSITAVAYSRTDYAVSDVDGKVKKEFNKESSVTSSVNLVAVSKCLRSNGLYYRYINKNEYLADAEAEYHKYIKKAIDLYGTNCKHEPNLILGCYYLAYCSIDNELSEILGGKKFKRLKDNAKEMARDAYLSSEYGWLVLEEPNTSINRTFVKICGGNEDFDNAQPANLFGFEYELDGVWVSSMFFMERAFCTENYSVTQNVGEKEYKMCSIVGIPKKSYYRVLYETYEDGVYMKLDVPNDWYFKKFPMTRLF